MNNAHQNELSKNNKQINVMSINGCKVVLNFLPESNGKTIDTVKKILTSSQYQGIADKAV